MCVRAPATLQHFHNGLIMSSSRRMQRRIPLFLFDSHSHNDFNDIYRLCMHPVKCVHVSERLHCVFIALRLSKERIVVWKTWCKKEEASGLCRTDRLSGSERSGETRREETSAARGKHVFLSFLCLCPKVWQPSPMGTGSSQTSGIEISYRIVTVNSIRLRRFIW